MIVTSLFGFMKAYLGSQNPHLPLRKIKELSKTRTVRFTLWMDEEN